MINGLPFIETLLLWVGSVSILVAFVMACLESGHGAAVEFGRSWLTSRWKTLLGLSFPGLVVVAIRWTRDAADQALKAMVVEFDRSPVFSPVVMAVVCLFLPLASIVNAALGGRPALLVCYASIVGGIFLLGLFAENRAFDWLKSCIAWVIVIAGLIGSPFYAFWTLTSHILGSSFLHGVIAGLFVAVVCYSGVMGVWTLVRSGRGFGDLGHAEKFMARVLFALPICYILYWLALLAGHFAVLELSPERSWETLLAVMGIGSLCFAVTMGAVDAGIARANMGHGLVMLVAGLVVAATGTMAIAGVDGQPHLTWFLMGRDGTGLLSLGPPFWVAHIPFALWVVMVGATVLIAVGRVVAALIPGGGAWIMKRSYLAAAVSVLAVGVLAITAANAIQ